MEKAKVQEGNMKEFGGWKNLLKVGVHKKVSKKGGPPALHAKDRSRVGTRGRIHLYGLRTSTQEYNSLGGWCRGWGSEKIHLGRGRGLSTKMVCGGVLKRTA